MRALLTLAYARMLLRVARPWRPRCYAPLLRETRHEGAWIPAQVLLVQSLPLWSGGWAVPHCRRPAHGLSRLLEPCCSVAGQSALARQLGLEWMLAPEAERRQATTAVLQRRYSAQFLELEQPLPHRADSLLQCLQPAWLLPVQRRLRWCGVGLQVSGVLRQSTWLARAQRSLDVSPAASLAAAHVVARKEGRVVPPLPRY